MLSIKEKLLKLLRDQGAVPLKYREIGRRIGHKHPQTVKHHIEKLKKQKVIKETNGLLALIKENTDTSDFLNIPFYGLANCGPANVFAEDKIEGYIKISRKILPRGTASDFYLVRASGNSMNKAVVGPNNKPIEDGDIAIVDAKDKEPKNNDYIVSVIDGCANIKKINYKANNEQVTLVSESTDVYSPIILHKSDDFAIAGKIVDILKMGVS